MRKGPLFAAICISFAFLAVIANVLPRTNSLRVKESASYAKHAKEFVAEPSPERLARGRYLVEGIAHCFECHGDQDFKNNFGQPKPGTRGAGKIAKNEAFEGETRQTSR